MEMAKVRKSGPVIREKWEKAAPNGTAGNQWASQHLYSQCLQGQYYFLYSQTYIEIVRSTILVTTYVVPFSPQITNSCKTSSPGRKY
jgi:hypothetical protein